METRDISGLKKYLPAIERYDEMHYRRCGDSGILLPQISLGLWHNFGHDSNLLEAQKILRKAFDLGIVHFDLANNYGSPYGSAELNFGRIFKEDFSSYRDELLISSKAGYDMWPGPYGNYGSRKYLISSLDQSLKRMGLDYVDVFYHHRPDLNTPLEETMSALDYIVRSGRALYVGISNYPAELAEIAIKLLDHMGTPCLIHQARYSLFDRRVEDDLLDTLAKHGVGMIAFSPLAQGMLTDRYLEGIPEGSRASKDMSFLKAEVVEEKLHKIRDLNSIANSRGQSLSEMSISWLLHKKEISSVLIGVSSVEQLEANVRGINTTFTETELSLIFDILNEDS